MSVPHIAYYVRPMRLPDVPRVAAIDQQSFSVPWSARSYVYEVTDSPHSHMVVIERAEQHPPANRLIGWWQRITGNIPHEYTLLAYGGLWLFGEGAHISTIASHPDHRRQGWGELAFVAMLRRAITLEATAITLEVRISNTGAQHLYTKYGFEIQGIKSRYYSDNQEDAYDMILRLTPQADHQIKARYAAFHQRLAFFDHYTHP